MCNICNTFNVSDSPSFVGARPHSHVCSRQWISLIKIVSIKASVVAEAVRAREANNVSENEEKKERCISKFMEGTQRNFSKLK